MNINDLTIGEAKELLAYFEDMGWVPTASATTTVNAPAITASALDDFAHDEIVIIRTYSAGVWCGKLHQKSGEEVILTEARRLWRWQCKESISLSGVAIYGIDQGRSKIAAPVNKVWLEAIEIIPISKDAAKTIMEAPIVQAE